MPPAIYRLHDSLLVLSQIVETSIVSYAATVRNARLVSMVGYQGTSCNLLEILNSRLNRHACYLNVLSFIAIAIIIIIITNTCCCSYTSAAHIYLIIQS